MRVRVTSNISEPLCRGRRVMFDEHNDGCVSFIYERLPNICFWCGHLTHDDKDCGIWLRSGGYLSNSEQQFGPWIRANQYKSSKKIVVEVQGYGQNRKTDNREERLNQGRRVMVGAVQKPPRTVEESNEPPICKPVVESETSGFQSITDFTATFQEIDEAIHGNGGFRNSNEGDKVVNKGSDTELVVMETDFTGQREAQHQEGPLFQHEGNYVEKERPMFTPGWANSNSEKKTKKCGHSNTKGGPTDGPQEVGLKSKGT